jgi:hypothetical protein
MDTNMSYRGRDVLALVPRNGRAMTTRLAFPVVAASQLWTGSVRPTVFENYVNVWSWPIAACHDNIFLAG